MVGHGHLDGLAAKTHLASHAAKRVLLLRLASKPDKPVPFAESRLIQNNLGTSNAAIALSEETIQCKVVNLWCEVPNPYTCVSLAWLQSCAVMVQLEPNGWGRVGDDLTPKSVHGNDGSLVGVKVDETIAGGLTGELVRHHLDADNPRLSHHIHGILQESLVHVGFQAPNPEGPNSSAYSHPTGFS